mgnify:CR=1 FL=1
MWHDVVPTPIIIGIKTLRQTLGLMLAVFEQVMQIVEFCQEKKIKFLNKKALVYHQG